MKANYNIEKELNEISARMHGTHFEQDRIIISDAIELINEMRESISKLTTRYQDGLNVHYQGHDESDAIECPKCGYEVTRNDDYPEIRPKHCPECGTKLIY